MAGTGRQDPNTAVVAGGRRGKDDRKLSTLAMLELCREYRSYWIEDQAFWPSYDLAPFPSLLPPPPTPPPSQVSKLVGRHTGKAEKERQLADGRGEGEGAKSYDGEKVWSSINVIH
jgi:hypothetical protein